MKNKEGGVKAVRRLGEEEIYASGPAAVPFGHVPQSPRHEFVTDGDHFMNGKRGRE
jgi:hypothetical protein